ncbi:MAG: hypothetical protein WA090_06560 [Candidatus Nanopelagicaceae bacterium]
MISFPSSFPRRVRIHGGGFDASARAMHRNAAIENVSVATIERTTMSTKTTIKRVALVAVAAMGFGLLSVVPSSAVSQSDTLTVSTATSSMTAGGTGATTTVTQSFLGQSSDSMSVTASLVSSPAGNAVLPVLTVGSGSVNTTPAIVSPGLVANVNANAAGYTATTGVLTATLSATVAGTYVVKFTPAVVGGTGVLSSAAVTWTVTVAAIATADSTTTSYKAVGVVAAPDSTSDALAITVPATQATQAATILIVPMAASASVASTTTLSATISGPGTLAFGTTQANASAGRAITAGGTASTYKYLSVWADGTTGVATITISAGTVVLATETVTFGGVLASYTLTPTNTVTKIGATDSVAIAAKDASGNTAVLGTYYVSSSNTAVATAAVTTGQTGSTFLVNGVAVGTAVITVANASSSPTITQTYTVTVGKATIGTLTMSTDKTSYATGEKVTLTVTAKGSDGTAVGDGTYATTFSSANVTSNISLQGTLPVASVTFAGGVATYVIYAPATAGTVTLTGTEGASTDAVIASSTAGKAVTVSFDVSNAASDAATDAANAATDAANYAADAADAATTAAQEATAAAVAAQESADAATAAVVALGLRVDSLLASVRAQLTSIANLIKKILAKK